MLNLNNMRVARARKGISQKEVAEKAGISPEHYCRIEHGKQNGSLKTIKAICNVLDIPINELVE